MLLSKHTTSTGTRWALDGFGLATSLTLSTLLELPRQTMFEVLSRLATGESLSGPLVAPIDPHQEVWAAGVTYLRSREARKAESAVADLYQQVYEAERPEIFFKSVGWRVVGDQGLIRARRDSHWSVPEAELVLVLNRFGEIVGYCAGNDVSARDIEGENPLYLPQAKIYNGACALGHGLWLCEPQAIQDLLIRLQIQRAGQVCFDGEARTSAMKRTLPELAGFLMQELDFPQGVFLMTGTCMVPEDGFSLQPGDQVQIEVGALKIQNAVVA